MEKLDLRELAMDVLVALGINIGFGLLAALGYGLLGRMPMLGPLALKFAILWGVMLLVTVMLHPIQRIFRLNLYDHSTAYVLINALAGALPLLIFSAFGALMAHQSAPGTSAIVLHLIGFLASYVAHTVVTVFFHGQIYMLINFVVALGGYLVFAAWPAAARVLITI
jgi:hypothetical protein